MFIYRVYSEGDIIAKLMMLLLMMVDSRQLVDVCLLLFSIGLQSQKLL